MNVLGETTLASSKSGSQLNLPWTGQNLYADT